MPVQDVVRRSLAEGLLAPGDRVVVAVSGGADSTALASILVEARDHGLPLQLFLAHVDHGWRGPMEAAEDRTAVKVLARRLRLAVWFSSPPPEGPRTEDAARRWRYACLAEAARSQGYTKVATAHHLRDQAETFLLRLLRGSGPVGLAGIPARRPLDAAAPGYSLEVVRPLLGVEPERLREHLGARGIPWQEDPTNRDLSKDRNEVRARLLAMEERGAAATRNLADLADRLRRRVGRHAAALEARLAGAVVVDALAEAVVAPRALLEGLLPADLDLALRRLGAPLHADGEGPWFTRRHVAVLEGLLREGGTLQLPRGLVLRVSPRTVVLARGALSEDRPAPRLVREDVPAAEFDLAGFVRERAALTAAMDAEKLGEAPRLRPLAREDRFTPFGASPAGPVGVVSWLERRGVPALLRRGVWVVEGATGVAWVVGHRIDRAHAVTGQTRTVARLRVTTA